VPVSPEALLWLAAGALSGTLLALCVFWVWLGFLLRRAARASQARNRWIRLAMERDDWGRLVRERRWR